MQSGFGSKFVRSWVTNKLNQQFKKKKKKWIKKNQFAKTNGYVIFFWEDKIKSRTCHQTVFNETASWGHVSLLLQISVQPNSIFTPSSCINYSFKFSEILLLRNTMADYPPTPTAFNKAKRLDSSGCGGLRKPLVFPSVSLRLLYSAQQLLTITLLRWNSSICFLRKLGYFCKFKLIYLGKHQTAAIQKSSVFV